jgi:hypothetical protein
VKDAPAASEPRFRFNWLPVVLILVTGAGVFYAGSRLYARPPLTPPPMPDFNEHNLVGLGGWLVLIAIGVIVRPLVLGWQLVRDFGYAFNLNTWEALTTPGTEAYDPVYGPLIASEVIGNTVLVSASLLLVLLFFRRKRAFPAVFIALMVFSLLFIAADTWAAENLIKDSEPEAPSNTMEIVKVFIQCVIWIPYMVNSRRVKLTFTR